MSKLWLLQLSLQVCCESEMRTCNDEGQHHQDRLGVLAQLTQDGASTKDLSGGASQETLHKRTTAWHAMFSSNVQTPWR
jgi:hypothetical protein